MDVSSINSDLIRGNVTTIILKALMNEDRYGYDILKEIEVKSGGQYKLKQPTLYSCLKRLEKQGLISSYWGDESDTEGGRRRYYALTEAGRTYLNKMQSEYEYSRTILDSLLSEEKFDFDNSEAPFDINSLRPYTKRSGDEEEVEKTSATVSTAVPVVSAPAAPEKQRATEQVVEKNTPPQQSNMFTPLDKGASSYDTDYRHSSKSVSEMLCHIEDILGKKKTEAETPIAEDEPVEETPAKDVKFVAENVKESDTEKSAFNPPSENFLYKGQLNTPSSSPVDEEVDNARRDAAKRALGIGAYQEKITDKTSKEENDNVDILGKIEKLVNEDAPKTEAEKTMEKKFDLFSKIPIDQQLHPERYALSDLSEKSEAQTIVAAPSPLPSQEEIAKDDPRMIFDKYRKKEEKSEPEKEPIKLELEPSPVPPATSFSFRKDNESAVNYRDAFSDLRNTGYVPENESAASELAQKPASAIDLKTKLFSEGYKLRAYSRENTENYYSMNYLKQNRINRDCYALMYVLICAEVFFGWLIFKERFSPMAYAALCIAALLVPAIPFVIWTVNPDKRVRGGYNFRTSILNRLMLYLNLLVIVCLVGFFVFGANINDGSSMVAPILIPALLLLNIPLSSVVYLILYKTKRYHIS